MSAASYRATVAVAAWASRPAWAAMRSSAAASSSLSSNDWVSSPIASDQRRWRWLRS